MVPGARPAVATDSTVPATEIDRSLVVKRPPTSATLTVNEATVFDDDVGVPEITPEVLSVRPAGNDPEAIDQVNGAIPPVELNVAEYATEREAGGSDDVVTAS